MDNPLTLPPLWNALGSQRRNTFGTAALVSPPTPPRMGPTIENAALLPPLPEVGAPVPSVVSTMGGTTNDTSITGDGVKPWSERNGLGQMFYNKGDNTFNWGAAGVAAQGLGALGSLWMGLDANKIAKDNLAFERESFNKNYGNQVKTYNTSLTDRANSRDSRNNTKSADTYVANHRLGG